MTLRGGVAELDANKEIRSCASRIKNCLRSNHAGIQPCHHFAGRQLTGKAFARVAAGKEEG